MSSLAIILSGCGTQPQCCTPLVREYREQTMELYRSYVAHCPDLEFPAVASCEEYEEWFRCYYDCESYLAEQGVTFEEMMEFDSFLGGIRYENANFELYLDARGCPSSLQGTLDRCPCDTE